MDVALRDLFLPTIVDALTLAEALGVPEADVLRLFLDGEIPARKVGTRWVTTKPAVLAWIAGPQPRARLRSLPDNPEHVT